MAISNKPKGRAPKPSLEDTLKADRRDLMVFGKAWVKYIKEEAHKDAAKSTFIPRDQDFYSSFSYKVEDDMVVIYSNWEWLGIIVEGTKGPYKMAWLTQEKGVNKVPLRNRDGSISIRTAPLTTATAWIHPKIAKHSFIQRAFRRAKQECVKNFIGRALPMAFQNLR